MDRAPEPEDGDERAVLLGWLAFHRDALAAKCAGLTDARLVTAPAAPSDLSLLGLVRHLTEMERWYLVRALSGRDLGLIYCTEADPDGDILGLTPDLAAPSLKRWDAERAEAESLLRSVESLDAIAPGSGRSVRWHVLKVLQEYARHNGHADLVRERIDGTRGE
jgi:hypothetical protein